VGLAFGPLSRADTVASLLGNFTINQFCRLTIASAAVDVHYAVVYGQLPALRELHAADADGNGVTSQAERDSYVRSLAPRFADGLELIVDGVRLPLSATRWTSSLPTEQGGFSLRVDVDFAATLPPAAAAARRTLLLTNRNYPGRIGWHEIVVRSTSGISIFDTNGYNSSATGELAEALSSLPEAGPLDERTLHLAFDQSGMPVGAVPPGARPSAGLPAIKSQVSVSAAGGNGWISRSTRQLVEAISGPHLGPRVALWALFASLLLGAVHALSPGHGKTIVGAYLIGSRGTPRHAVFLGLTVTVTHTLGVFLLGFATLYASRFIVAERLLPILSLVSALLVLVMGIVLLVQRGRIAWRALRTSAAPQPTVFFPYVAAVGGTASGCGLVPANRLAQSNDHLHEHSHAHTDGTLHSHGGGALHSHLPPGAGGEQITWRSLLTLGISGGLVPCPSAMVLLLAAVALNKTAFGMLLVCVFSIGLALTLTAVGLVFLYARNRFRKRASAARWPYLLLVLSAATITVVGIALLFGALNFH
jgi:ABC-type nickel/cobalt efflux system permease component RcnA